MMDRKSRKRTSLKKEIPKKEAMRKEGSEALYYSCQLLLMWMSPIILAIIFSLLNIH